MVPSATRKGNKTYRYYRCSHAEKAGHDTCPTRMINADRVERFVVDQLRQIGADPALQAATFDAAVAQVRAERRGLRAESKRLERDRDGIRAEVERLVATLSRTDGPAAEAVAARLNATQERLGTIETRLREIADTLAALKAQDVDRDAVARALVDFDEIWNVLLVPERERVLRLVLDRITYDGSTQELTLSWRLTGFGQLAAEVAS